MNEIINSSTLRQGAAPWNTEIVSFNQNVKLDLWGQSANDIVKIRRVRVQEGAIINTTNQICCITPATKAQVKASKLVLRCDCDGSRPAELTTDVSSIILSAGSYVFEYSGSGFAAKTTVLAYEKSDKEACDCACAQAPCLPVSVTTASTGMTSASVTIVSGSDAYGREVTVNLFNGENEYEQVGVNGDVLTFTGLHPNTTYSVVAKNDCGEKDSKQVTTAACPAVSITMAAAGTNAVTVTVVSGGSAWVQVGDAKQYVSNGATATFSGLAPDTEYFAVATSDCGSFTTASTKTLPCPAISLTQTSNTTSSINVTLVTGGSASVFVGADEVVLANGASHTFTGLTAGKTYTAKVISACGNKASFPIATAACPAVDFTATALSTTSLEVMALAGMPLDVSIVSQGGVVLDAIDGLTSTIVFTDLPEGAIVTVKAVNECGKKKQLNVNLPGPVANPCPSFSLADASPYFKGFAYVAGDLIDPAATVAYRGGFIYPAAGEGHTVKVTDNLGTLIGYAVNQSDCANPCCTPLINRTSVDGGIINDGDDTYYIKGEVNKCDGSPVLPTDRLFNKGSLKTCVNGTLVDLDCNMIVKTIQECCESNVITGTPTGLFSSAWCVNGDVTNIDQLGRLVWQSRDDTMLAGSSISSGAPVFVQFDVTNNFDCPSLLEISMQAICIAYKNTPDNLQTVTFIHKIGDTLNVAPANYGSTQWIADNGGWSWTDMSYNSNSNEASGGAEPYPFARGSSSAQTTAPAMHKEILAAGQTKTFFAQFWIVVNDVVLNDVYSFHAGFDKNSFWKLTRAGEIT